MKSENEIREKITAIEQAMRLLEAGGEQAGTRPNQAVAAQQNQRELLDMEQRRLALRWALGAPLAPPVVAATDLNEALDELRGHIEQWQRLAATLADAAYKQINPSLAAEGEVPAFRIGMAMAHAAAHSPGNRLAPPFNIDELRALADTWLPASPAPTPDARPRFAERPPAPMRPSPAVEGLTQLMREHQAQLRTWQRLALTAARQAFKLVNGGKASPFFVGGLLGTIDRLAPDGLQPFANESELPGLVDPYGLYPLASTAGAPDGTKTPE